MGSWHIRKKFNGISAGGKKDAYSTKREISETVLEVQGKISNLSSSR